MYSYKPKNAWLRTANRLALWCFLLTLLGFIILNKLLDMKSNNTQVHDKANTALLKIDLLKKKVDSLEALHRKGH